MLNKHGWGLREMLVLSALLIIFVLIASYYIYVFLNSYNIESTVNNYSLLEEKLEEQTKIYLNDYYDEVLTSDKLTITRSVLKSYNLDVILEDSDGNSCSGYAVAYKTKGIVNVDGYIKCKDYITLGYEDWRK